MESSWLSKTSSGVFNYLYKHITGDDEEEESAKPSSALEVLSKGNVWITDLPTNNYEPIEASYGARRPAAKKSGKRVLEEKIAVLKEQYDAKNKEVAWLEEKLSKFQENKQRRESDFAEKIQEKEQEIEKAKRDVLLARENCLEKESEIEELSNELNSRKDTLEKVFKANDSLKTQVAELKSVLSAREEINKKQRELTKMLAVDAQNRFKKASAESAVLTEELKAYKTENAKLVAQVNCLQNPQKELQQQLSDSNEKNHEQLVYITELKTTLADTDRILKEVSDDILKKEQEFKFCKEREMSLEEANSSLKQQLTELQERLDDMTNTQAKERDATKKAVEDKLQQIVDLSCQLDAKNSELQNEIKEKEQIITQLKKCKVSDQEKELQSVNAFLKQQLEDRLNDMTNSQAKERAAIVKALAEKSQQIDELCARNIELEKEIREKGRITTQLDNMQVRERKAELTDFTYEELEEMFDFVCNEPTKGQDYIDWDELLQIVESSARQSDRNAVLEKKSKERERKIAQLVKEQGEELKKINYSLKHQLIEIQQRMDNKNGVQEQQSEEIIVEQADESQRTVELQNAVNSSCNAALQNLNVHHENMTGLLASCEGGDHLNVQPQLSVTMTNDTRVEQNVPVQIKKDQTEKDDESASKTVKPVSRAAVKGKGRRKSVGESMSKVGDARAVVRYIPGLRRRHEGFRRETIEPRYMSVGGIHYQPGLVSNPTVSQLAQTKKHDDWLPQNQVNLGSTNNEEQGFFSSTFGKWFGF